MTWDTVISQFGGLFGLCLGGSVISFVEFFYAFTFKYYEYLRMSKSRKRSVETVPVYKFSNNNYSKRISKFKHTNPFLYGN